MADLTLLIASDRDGRLIFFETRVLFVFRTYTYSRVGIRFKWLCLRRDALAKATSLPQ